MTEVSNLVKPTAEALIAASDTRRDVGHDTFNASMGKLAANSNHAPKSKFSVKLCPADASGILKGLFGVAEHTRVTQREHFVTHSTREHEIAYSVECYIVAAHRWITFKGDDCLRDGETVKFKLVVSHENSRQTEMQVKVTRDKNGYYWLGVLANPTSLLNAYNAYAVAFPDVSNDSELAIIMRVPFRVLRRIVGSVNTEFKWHPDTKRRIIDLAFRNCPSQVFTYMLTAPKTPAELMGFLRCVFSVPYSDRHRYRLLSDDLGFEMQVKSGDDGIQTLLFTFKKAGRIAWSVSLYDKLAKAKADAEVIKVEVGDKSVLDFLSKVVRLDITIHEEGQRDMHHEARISSRGDASITTADYCRAIQVMDAGEGRSGKKFVRWMLDRVFGEMLKLWALLAYAPSKLEKGRVLLDDYNATAAAGFVEWCHKGFEHIETGEKRSVSFVQFLEHHAESTVSRDIARRTREKLLAIKLDPDIPLRGYDAFYERTFSWDLSDDDRHKLATAYESGDDKTAASIHRRGRRNSVEVITEISSALTKMIKSAHAPANTLEATKKPE